MLTRHGMNNGRQTLNDAKPFIDNQKETTTIFYIGKIEVEQQKQVAWVLILIGIF